MNILLSGYTKEIFRSKCMPGAVSLHCYAHLNEDVGPALPYLNAALGGALFTKEPLSVTFKNQGKLITVHPRKIAVNALKDEDEAEKILQWLKNEINSAWKNRETITPCFDSAPKPVLTKIIQFLPKTNCRACHEPTCLVFAIRVMEGVKDQDDCPFLAEVPKKQLQEYLSQFCFEE